MRGVRLAQLTVGRTRPGDADEQPVRVAPVEQAGRRQERDPGQEPGRGQQAAFAEEGRELVDRREKAIKKHAAVPRCSTCRAISWFPALNHCIVVPTLGGC